MPAYMATFPAQGLPTPYPIVDADSSKRSELRS
jgi:hypothetical protein